MQTNTVGPRAALAAALVVAATAFAATACSNPNDTRLSLAYPATRTVDVVDDYHGTKVAAG